MKKIDLKSAVIGAAVVVALIKWGDRIPVIGGPVGSVTSALK